MDLTVAQAAFGSATPVLEVGGDAKEAWFDVVLHTGEERQLTFGSLERASVLFLLSLRSTRGEHAEPRTEWNQTVSRKNGLITLHGMREEKPTLTVTVPEKPMKTRAQNEAASLTMTFRRGRPIKLW